MTIVTSKIYDVPSPLEEDKKYFCIILIKLRNDVDRFSFKKKVQFQHCFSDHELNDESDVNYAKILANFVMTNEEPYINSLFDIHYMFNNNSYTQFPVKRYLEDCYYNSHTFITDEMHLFQFINGEEELNLHKFIKNKLDNTKAVYWHITNVLYGALFVKKQYFIPITKLDLLRHILVDPIRKKNWKNDIMKLNNGSKVVANLQIVPINHNIVNSLLKDIRLNQKNILYNIQYEFLRLIEEHNILSEDQ